MVNGVGNNPLILIVDDAQETRELLVNWLELNSYRTLQAADGEEALRLAVAHRPDLILLDVMMPHMDGVEVCRRLKVSASTASIPIILITGKTPVDARVEGLMAGAVDFITKPINLRDLTRRVESALTADPNTPPDTKRLVDEAAHIALTVLESTLVWLLALDASDQTLISQTIATRGGSRGEAEFLRRAGGGQLTPRYPLNDAANPLCAALIRRQAVTNLPLSAFAAAPQASGIAEGAARLGLSALTVVPLVAAGRAVGVMVIGNPRDQALSTARAQQMLAVLAGHAATALDYSRLMSGLHQRDVERTIEQTFQTMILETMSDALVVIDAQGVIRFVNQRLLRMTGYPPNYLEGLSVGVLFHPDDREDVMIGLLRETASTMKFNQRLVTSSGEIIDVLLSRSRTQADHSTNQVIILSDIRLQKAREEALERQARQLMALNKAAQAIASNLSLHETLQEILNAALSVVEAQGASLFLVNPANVSELIVVAAAGYRAEFFVGLRVPFGQGVAGWVAREARSQLVTNPQEDPRFYDQVDKHSGTSTKSLVAVPLIHAEQVIGVIEVVNKLNGANFDSDDVRLLESMAGTAAVSIVNARLFDQSQRRVAELATLLGASEAASSTLELAHVLEHVARSLLESLEVARCIVTSWNSSKRRLETLADVADAYWPDRTGPIRALDTSGLANRAVVSGQPAAASRDECRTAPTSGNAPEAIMPSVMVVPVLRGGKAEGIVTLYSVPSGSVFSAQQVAQAAQITAEWAQSALSDTNLSALDTRALSLIARRLLEGVEGTCWVHIESVDLAAHTAQMLREIGFAEWTRSPSSHLSVEDYPTLRTAIEKQRVDLVLRAALPASSAERIWLERCGGDMCLIVPLINRGATIGAFLLIDHSRDTFDEQEINLAQGIANVVSNALENARLYESLQSRAKALESAYSELQDLDRAKDQFIQNISHELRTPLIHVLGYAGLLAEGALGPITDEQREALNIIVEKGQRVANIVEDMVAAQAQEAQVFEFAPVNITALISDVLRANDARIRRAGVQLITHFQDKLPSVRADARLIASAFEKLLDNALKFGADGQRIEVAIRDTNGPVVQIAVRDYGIGIAPSEHEKIFRRFYQVDGGVNRRYGGAGLGLAVARNIIEGHGGRIGVKSRLNEGSIFYFTLPKYDMGQL